jgi:hypothetical protein
MQSLRKREAGWLSCPALPCPCGRPFPVIATLDTARM